MSENELLYRYKSKKNIDAKTALKNIWTTTKSEIKPFLLVYTPTFCRFATFDGENIVVSSEKEKLNCDHIFELRCFCEEYELRWVREESNGKAVLLSDKKHEDIMYSEESIQYVFSRTDQYLLWGNNKSTGNGETELFDHRIGSLRVPIETQKKRIYLHFKEYFKEGCYGNLICLERCLALKDSRFIQENQNRIFISCN